MENIYVSPTGSDSASGTSDAPFKTITRAQEYAREKRGSVTVNLFDGYYFINETLRFDEETGKWIYKQPDWMKLKQIAKNEGPKSQERLNLRRSSYKANQWVREALAPKAN